MRLARPLGERSLADAGFADVERIVLAAAAQHLDRALDFFLSADQGIDLALARQLVEVVGEFRQRIAARLLGAFGFASSVAAGGLLAGILADLGDAVRDVVDDVEARDFLLAEEIHGVRILLAEDRDQHVGAGDFLTA